tara:strand:- start:181 stop:315 length:135 start_codon:yes stop_codon:yes gene_type:complete
VQAVLIEPTEEKKPPGISPLHRFHDLHMNGSFVDISLKDRTGGP